MIVKCPNCNTKYNFDDSRVRDELKVRCTRCKHVFKLFAPDKEELSEPFPLVETKTEEKHEHFEPERRNSFKRETEPVYAEEPPDKRRRNRITFIALSALLILVLSLIFVVSRFDVNINIPFISSQEEQTAIQQQTEFTEEDVKDISLENIRQYFVNNDKIGQLFVIEGQAVNNFNMPKSMIKLKASLYSDEGSVVGEKVFLCGNVASLFQLQVSSKEEIESTLQSRLGILTTNKHVNPGGYTPFMVVFYNPSEEMQEFGLEVIEAREPTS